MLAAIDNLSARHKDAVLLVARLLMSALFANEVYFKLTHYSAALDYFEALKVPLPALSLPASTSFEAVASAALIIGYWTRPFAFLIGLFCIATALLAHTNFSNVNEQIHFLKNMAIAGGCLAVFGRPRWNRQRRLLPKASRSPPVGPAGALTCPPPSD